MGIETGVTIYPMLVLAIVIFHCTRGYIEYMKERDEVRGTSKDSVASTDIDILPFVLYAGRAYWFENSGIYTARVQDRKILYGEKEVIVDTELQDLSLAEYIAVLDELERIQGSSSS